MADESPTSTAGQGPETGKLPRRTPFEPPAATVALPEPFAGELSPAEAAYARNARAANTQRGYRSDWGDFTTWANGTVTLPATPETVNAYVLDLIAAGSKVSTVARRLSSIGHAHRIAGFPSPTDHPRVQLVWQGIRRTHAARTDSAPPLLPPVLWDVLAALPASPAGIRDRALILVGFVGALRRSELARVRVEDLADHARGRVLTIPTSKTDPYAAGQLVILPRGHPGRCPVTAIDHWLDVGQITDGPLFRAVHRSGSVRAGGLSAAAVNDVVQRACTAALGPGHGYSAHSLRSGFSTHAASRGASDRAIAHQTRHRSLASLTPYIRHETAWTDNAATNLDL
jgi:integrase